MKAYWALIVIDLKLALRMRMVIFFNYLFPLIFFFTFGAFYHAGQNLDAITQVITMSLALGILGNGLFGAGMRTLQERELNILRRYKVTPITPGPLLVASMVTGWMLFMPYCILLLLLSRFFYYMPWPHEVVSLLVFISLGLIAFRSVGMVIAAVANTMQEGTILVQLIYLPMLFLSGAAIPSTYFGRSMQMISELVPATYLVRGMHAIMLANQNLVNEGISVIALGLTTLMGWFVGVKLFRWEKEEKIRARAKVWVLGVLMPFFVLGLWRMFHSADYASEPAGYISSPASVSRIGQQLTPR